MELKSVEYVWFVFIAVFIYYAVCKIPGLQRIVLLLAGTYFIWKTSGIKSLCIVFILISVTFVLGNLIEKAVSEKKKGTACIFMWAGIFFVLGILCYFKFFRDTFSLVQAMLLEHGIRVSSLVQPVGISFYSLSLIAYLMDVFHRKHPSEKKLIDYCVFATYFPAVIQGPVNLYKNVWGRLSENSDNLT